MDDQPPRTHVHAQLPVSPTTLFSYAGERGFLVGTPDLTEGPWPCIIPQCPEVFFSLGNFSRHYYTAHTHRLEPDEHGPTVTNAASSLSNDASHTHHISTVSTSMSQSMSQSMSPPISNENCVDWQKKKRCILHTTKKIGPRMKPGDACEVCKKQKKKCQGAATCPRAQRLVQAVRMEPNAPNATSGSQEWEGSQSASPGFTHASSPIFMAMDGQVLADVSILEHAPSDPSSMLPSLNTLFTGSDITMLDLARYLDHDSPTAVPYLPHPITAAGPSFRELPYPDCPNPGPDRLSASILQIPDYLTNTPFSLLVENRARLAQRGLQTNEELKQKMQLMLPSTWNSEDHCNRLVLSTDGMAVEYKGLWKYYGEAAVRSNYPIPPQCGLFYWEVNLKVKCPKSRILVGVCPRALKIDGTLDDGRWYYSTSTGTVFCSRGREREFGPKVLMDNTIGCGINFKAMSIFFTINGEFMGIPFKTIPLQYPLYPFVALEKPGDQVETNFGARAFKFDILRYMKGKSLHLWQARDLQYCLEDSSAKTCQCSKIAPVSLTANTPLFGDLAQVISNPVSQLHHLKHQYWTKIVRLLRDELYEKWAAADDALVDASTKFWQNFNRTFYGPYDRRAVLDHEWLNQAIEEQYALLPASRDSLSLFFELVKGIQAHWDGLNDIQIRNKLNEFLAALEAFFQMDDECPDASRRAEALKTFYAMQYDSNRQVLHGIITWRILLWFNIVFSFCASCRSGFDWDSKVSKDEALKLLTKHVLN